MKWEASKGKSIAENRVEWPSFRAVRRDDVILSGGKAGAKDRTSAEAKRKWKGIATKFAA